MGGDTSIENQRFKKEDWEQIEQTDDAKIWRNRNDPSYKVEQYTLFLNSAEDLAAQKKLYSLRKNNQQIVSSVFFDEESSREFCSTHHKCDLYIEHMPLTFGRLDQTPYPDILHVYEQTAIGFDKLASQLGYFTVSEDLIGISESGVAKVWATPNFASTEGIFIHKSEEKMVQSIIESVNRSADNNLEGIPTFPEYYANQAKPLTFAAYNQAIKDYAVKYWNGNIPNRLICVDNVGGVEAINQRVNNINPEPLTFQDQPFTSNKNLATGQRYATGLPQQLDQPQPSLPLPNRDSVQINNMMENRQNNVQILQRNSSFPGLSIPQGFILPQSTLNSSQIPVQQYQRYPIVASGSRVGSQPMPVFKSSIPISNPPPQSSIAITNPPRVGLKASGFNGKFEQPPHIYQSSFVHQAVPRASHQFHFAPHTQIITRPVEPIQRIESHKQMLTNGVQHQAVINQPIQQTRIVQHIQPAQHLQPAMHTQQTQYLQPVQYLQPGQHFQSLPPPPNFQGSFQQSSSIGHIVHTNPRTPQQQGHISQSGSAIQIGQAQQVVKEGQQVVKQTQQAAQQTQQITQQIVQHEQVAQQAQAIQQGQQIVQPGKQIAQQTQQIVQGQVTQQGKQIMQQGQATQQGQLLQQGQATQQGKQIMQQGQAAQQGQLLQQGQAAQQGQLLQQGQATQQGKQIVQQGQVIQSSTQSRTVQQTEQPQIVSQNKSIPQNINAAQAQNIVQGQQNLRMTPVLQQSIKQGQFTQSTGQQTSQKSTTNGQVLQAKQSNKAFEGGTDPQKIVEGGKNVEGIKSETSAKAEPTTVSDVGAKLKTNGVTTTVLTEATSSSSYKFSSSFKAYENYSAPSYTNYQPKNYEVSVDDGKTPMDFLFKLNQPADSLSSKKYQKQLIAQLSSYEYSAPSSSYENYENYEYKPPNRVYEDYAFKDYKYSAEANGASESGLSVNGLNGMNSLNGLNGMNGLNGLNGMNGLNGLTDLNGMNESYGNQFDEMSSFQKAIPARIQSLEQHSEMKYSMTQDQHLNDGNDEDYAISYDPEIIADLAKFNIKS